MNPLAECRCRTVSTAVLAGLLVFANGAPSSVAIAQSDPLSLTPFRGLIDHVSANSSPSGIPSAGAQSWPHSISGDGRYVVIESNAWDLVPNDFNSSPDIFLRDRQTGSTTRVSVAADGGDGDGMSQYATISSNGRQVAFSSGASNLVAGDTNGHWDVFVRDLNRGRTVSVSVATDGTQSDADSGFPVISADGRFVAFQSSASTLVPGAMPYQPMEAYIHDRDSDRNGVFDEPGGTTTTLVSVSTGGTVADARVDNLRVSADGRFVLFETDATNIAPVPTPNYFTHLYLRDLQANQTTLIDAAATAGPSASGVLWRSSDMSDDGRYITYASPSSDIVPSAANGQAQVFRYDANADAAARTTIVSTLPGGTLADDWSYATSVSADGRYIAFTTEASNLALPAPVSGTRGVVVRDMVEGTFTRVDVIETGAAFDHTYPNSPAISADGTAVAFQSNAQNALNGAFTWGADHVFVATAFTASALSVSMPMAGGMAAIDVNTTPVSGWQAVSFDDWIVVTDGAAYAAGPRTVNYLVSANDSGIARDGHVRVGSTTVSIHQDGDGDTTPPVITPIVTGTLGGDGWYVGNVTVQWTVSDPESPIVNQSWNCGTVVALTSDALDAAVTCEATSHGGNSSNTVHIRRDTTPPVVTISTPSPTAYAAGSTVTPSFTCDDGYLYSGTVTCSVSEGSTPLDTTPGRHVFTVSASDRAGNSTSKSVEYFVGTGVCVSPNDSLRAWWRFEENTVDALANLDARPTTSGALQYVPAIVGQSWQPYTSTLLSTGESGRLQGLNALTVAAWVRPAGQIGESGTIVSNPVLRIARYGDGTLRWAFNQPDGFAWVNTGVVIPRGVWTHIAVSQEMGLVKTYLNGRLIHTQQLNGPVSTATSLFIGGRADIDAFYIGGFDELQVFGSALTAEEIDAIAMAGNGGLCLPKVTTLTVSVPPTVAYGSMFPVTATLRDEAGNPIAGKLLTLDSYVSAGGYYAGGASGTTDSAGQIQVPLPMSSDATIGRHVPGVRATFAGDAHDTSSRVDADVTVGKGTPTITWPSPSSIVYGTELAATQLNAAADADGTFTYSPAAGTFLDAGTHTLNVTFTPSDLDRWNEATATTTVIVERATPSVTITGGTFTYDNLPHAGIGRATGVFGEALTPIEVRYDGGSQTPPVNAGSYVVSASYAGSTNYTAGFASEVPLIVARAVPTVTITGGPFSYNGQTRQASVMVQGVGGEVLSPYTVQYNGGSALPVDAGSHAVSVSYDGSDNYQATSIDGTLVINKATPIMSLYDITLTYDGQPHGVSVNVAGVHGDWLTPVEVTYNGSTTDPIDAGVYTMEARYDGSTNYNAISRTATLSILKADPYLTWTIPASIFYGTPVSTAQLNATSNVPGSFAYTPSAGTVLNAGTHTLTVVFTPADIVNYQTKSISTTLSIWKAYPVLAWNRPQDIVFGTALGDAQLNATANVPGTFVYSPPPATVLNAGIQILSATFTPDDIANYNGGSTVATVLTVAKASSTIGWSAPADVVYGTALSAAQLNATANVPGTFNYSPAAGAVLNAGVNQLSVTFTPDDAANYLGSTATVPFNVSKAASTITWSAPANIVYGTALSATQLNATANVPGTFNYSPAAGAVLNAGVNQLSVSFTPDDAANYVGSSATVTLNVTRAATNITWPAAADITYGTALNAAQLNAAGSVPGTFSYSPAAGTVLGAGSHQLSVTFTPSDAANYTGSSATHMLTVNKAPLMIAANPASKPYGAPLPVFSASTSDFRNGDSLASLTGTLSFATPATVGSAVGTYPVTPQGVSSPNYTISFVTGTLSVVQASTGVSFGVSANPSGFNQPVTLTAYVSAVAPGAGVPSGVVQFFDGGTLLGTVTLAGATATLTTNGFSAGAHTLTATYSGDASFGAGTEICTLTVNAASSSSTTAVSSSANPATVGQSVTLTATVNASGALSGNVEFYDGAVLLGTVPLSGTTARFTTTGLASGGHPITAKYLGNSSIPPSTSPAFAEYVQPSGAKTRASSVALIASPSSATLGSVVTLTATATGSNRQPPTGAIVFMVNGTVIGQGTLAATGSATGATSLATSALPHGTHRVEAVYLGDATYRASTTSMTLVVN